LKWSALKYSSDFYNPFDENQRAIRGFWLTTQGIDLENLPIIFNEQFKFYEKPCHDNYYLEDRKVYLNDIVGTSYKDYGNMKIIESYMKIKRADIYIAEGVVTKKNYDNMLRKPANKQDLPVILSENQEGTYFIDGNGNHRVIFYKMMMLSEIALNSTYACDKSFNFNRELFKEIKKKYWLNVRVKKECNN